MSDKIKKIVSNFDFAFQPVININTGIVYGYEALLRNFEKKGFKDISDVFDYAHDKNILHKLDLVLFEKAIYKYTTIDSYKNARFFYNLDNRVLEMPEYSYSEINKIVEKYMINRENICFEISKFHRIEEFSHVKKILNKYKELGYSIGINDFGSGFSNMEKLFLLEPDIIKIDRLFLQNINDDIKKQFFTSSIINLVHTLGGLIVAHGLETKEELLTCRKIGCDMAQGFYIQKPIKKTERLNVEYLDKVHVDEKKSFFVSEDKALLESKLKRGEAVYIDTDIGILFKTLENNKEVPVIVVLDLNDKPIGIIEEKVIKKYLYKLYGREILAKKKLKDLVSPCLTCDINFEISKIIDIFNVNRDIKQLVISDNGRYVGYLDFIALISIVSEKKLINASNENPLTKLPGNNLINEYIKDALVSSFSDYAFIYFDFDNFKAFNDTYGFKKGDLAITLFADLMRRKMFKSSSFEAHIGGDDFFIGVKYEKKENYLNILEGVSTLVSDFNTKARQFYSDADLEKECLMAKDRDGNMRCFPLLQVSASILEIKKENKDKYSIEDISNMIFKLKKTSKIPEVSISAASLCKKYIISGH